MEKILIIDDESMIREGISELLRHNGYEALEADNGFEAIKITEETIPDLIIADILMPGLSGYETINLIRQRHSNELIPFIFLTAKVDKTDIRTGMNYGADDYLTKPFKANDLLLTVKARLKKKNKFEEKIDEIIFNISHYLPDELRNPLVTISGYSEMLIDNFESFNLNDKLEILKNIKQSEFRLSKKVKRFLFYSELLLISYNKEDFPDYINSLTNDPKEIISQIISEKREEYNRVDNISMNLENVSVEIFEEHFKSAVNELIDNALKFTKPGMPIEIGGYLRNDKYIIRFIDYGKGSKRERIENSNPFKRSISNNYGEFKGGLGLEIVRKIMSIYNGEFRIESKTAMYTKADICLPVYKV